MRLSNREVTGFADIVEILNRCDTVRLGINGGEFPYVVPVSFGFEADGGRIAIYFHGAKEGLKHELLEKDRRVCVEADVFHRYAVNEEKRILTAEYESVIGFGTAETVSGKEAEKGLALICAHAGFENFSCGSEKALLATRVYKIELRSFTGKRRFV